MPSKFQVGDTVIARYVANTLPPQMKGKNRWTIESMEYINKKWVAICKNEEGEVKEIYVGRLEKVDPGI